MIATFHRTFRAMRNRNFRLHVVGQAVTNSGAWMQKVAQAWLVLELTGSGTMLGITAAAQQIPMLILGPWGGLIADRFDKRRILIWVSVGGAMPALVLGVLTATGSAQIWMVWALAVVLGITEVVEKPARHTFATELVSREDLVNAVSLTNVVTNVGKVVGPALGGFLIEAVGLSWSFFVNAASFLAVIVALLLMRTDQITAAPRTGREKGQLRAGLHYIRREPELLGPLLLLTVTGLMAYEWTTTVPLLARDTFSGGAGAVGILFSAMGVGAIVGGLGVAGSRQVPATRLAVTALLLAGVLAALAAAPTFPVAVALMVLVGVASVSFRVVTSTWLQLRAEPQMRGRVVAWLLMAVAGTTPIGGPLVGWIGETFGARAAMAAGAIATAVAALAYLAYLRFTRLRQLRQVGTTLRSDSVSEHT